MFLLRQLTHHKNPKHMGVQGGHPPGGSRAAPWWGLGRSPTNEHWFRLNHLIFISVCFVSLFLVSCATDHGIEKPVPPSIVEALVAEIAVDTLLKEKQSLRGKSFKVDFTLGKRKHLDDLEFYEELKSSKRLHTPFAGQASRRFDVRVSQRPAHKFFMSLVNEEPTINMIVHPDVVKNISLELKNVTVDEVVEVACEMYQLDCRPFLRKGDHGIQGYKIFPWQLVTKTYRIDSLSMVRNGRSETVVSSGDRQESIAIRQGNDQSSSISNSTTSGSRIETDHKSDFWADLEKTIRSILKLDLAISSIIERTDVRGKMEKTIERKRYELSEVGVRRGRSYSPSSKKKSEGRASVSEYSKEGRKKRVTSPEPESGQLAVDIKSIMINRQAGLLTVRAYPKEHQDIVSFLRKLQIRSQRQVVLEAKILEVILNDGFQFGVDWLAINKGLGSSRFPSLTSEPQGGTKFLGSMLNASGNSQFSQGFILSRDSADNAPINMAFREHDFVGFIDLLQQQGEVQMLSSPRISTINNQKAVIKVGSDEFFITGLDSGSVVGSGDAAKEIRDPTAKFTRMFSGVSLDVTPQIGMDGMITLHVHPMVTDVVDKVKSFTVNDKGQELPLAYSQTREADSIIRVQNGEVAVIGGMMKKKTRNSKAGFPLLADVPILGALFGQNEKSVEKSELVILLRPVVVDSQQGWGNQITRQMGQIQEMQGELPLWWTQ